MRRVPFFIVQQEIAGDVDVLATVAMLHQFDDAKHPLAVQIGFPHRPPICFRVLDFERGLNFHAQSPPRPVIAVSAIIIRD